MLVPLGVGSCASALCHQKSTSLVPASSLTAPWLHQSHPFPSASKLPLHTTTDVIFVNKIWLCTVLIKTCKWLPVTCWTSRLLTGIQDALSLGTCPPHLAHCLGPSPLAVCPRHPLKGPPCVEHELSSLCSLVHAPPPVAAFCLYSLPVGHCFML